MSSYCIRDLLTEFEKVGELTRVKEEVDKDWELSSVARQIFNWEQKERPCLLFENIHGYQTPVVTAVFGNQKRYAIALGCEEGQIWGKWKEALSRPIPPKVVSEGICQENIVTGDDIELLKFPIPTWSPDKDAGPYLTATCVITKDPETGIQNIGTYRCHIQGPKTIGISIQRGRHAGIHLSKWEELGKSMDIAVCLGADPTIPITSVGPVPFGVDEAGVAGGLKGEPIEVVKGKTVDLLLPASAEIIIEGKIKPHTLTMEAPFGEFTGYMGLQRKNPRLDVTAITFRNKPLLHAFLSQRPPSESSMLRKIVSEPIIKEKLSDIGIPGIVDLSMSEASGSWFHVDVSIKKIYPGHAREVMMACWAVGRTYFRRVTVVDDDIDVRDPFAVEWAVATRCRPDKDIVIIPEHISTFIDPVMTPEMQTTLRGGISAKYGIDATKSHEYSKIALPDEKYLQKVKESWEKYGVRKVGQ